MSEQEPNQANLTRSERDYLQKIADRDGLTFEQAVTKLGQRALARIVKKRSGKTAAKVYTMPRKK